MIFFFFFFFFFLLIWRIKTDNRIRQLSEVLMSELRVSPEKSLQGGPRGASRAVLLLSRLGHLLIMILKNDKMI